MSEIKGLKAKQSVDNDLPENVIIAKLSKENSELNTKVKKVSEEMKAGKSSLKKVEENNVILAKSIRDLQDKLNNEINKSSKIEVQKRRLERNSDRLEEIIEINDERSEPKVKTPPKHTREEKCKFFEEHGYCRYGKQCYNFHPSRYCEYFLKVGRCPVENCLELHSQKDCIFWSRGFCKNERCRMKHDPKLKGTDPKRGRSRSPPINGQPDKRYRQEEKQTDVYYNNTIEQRFNKQEEHNHFLAKSLAGISADLKSLSSNQTQQHPQAIQPSGRQEHARPFHLPPFPSPAPPQPQHPVYPPYM